MKRTSRQAVHAIRSGTLVHGTGADSVRDAVVLVEDGRIGSGGRGGPGGGGERQFRQLGLYGLCSVRGRQQPRGAADAAPTSTTRAPGAIPARRASSSVASLPRVWVRGGRPSLGRSRHPISAPGGSGCRSACDRNDVLALLPLSLSAGTVGRERIRMFPRSQMFSSR
jgi:hypothetical protein